MTTAALLREARAVGVDFEQVAGRIRIVGKPEPDLRARLKENRVELIEVLTGSRCRWCGVALAWPAPAGIVYADGTAECHPCGDAEVWRILAAAHRVVNSPDALADEAELMLRAGGLSR